MSIQLFELKDDSVVYNMSSLHKPALSVPNGATVRVHTCDCFTNQIQSEDQDFGTLDWGRINPATGPIYVGGAEAGDLLVVHIVKIELTEQGVMTTGPNLGVLGDELTANSIKTVPVRDGYAVFAEDIHLPLCPMIGVIGTAPADVPVSCGTPGEHGGNMDCTAIREGASLILPVNVPGALFALGDVHASMGDGEVAVCGIEIAAVVTLRFDVLKGKAWHPPMIVNDTHVITIASAETLDEASEQATKNMVDFLAVECEFPRDEAILLLSAAGDLRVCQIVDPLRTARFELPRWIAERRGFQFL